MCGNAVAAMEYLERTFGQARPQLLAQERVRDGVIMLLHLNVIVETGATLCPFGILLGLLRQGFESRTVQVVKQLPPA